MARRSTKKAVRKAALRRKHIWDVFSGSIVAVGIMIFVVWAFHINDLPNNTDVPPFQSRIVCSQLSTSYTLRTGYNVSGQNSISEQLAYRILLRNLSPTVVLYRAQGIPAYHNGEPVLDPQGCQRVHNLFVYARQHGFDAVIPLGFFWHESELGKTGYAFDDKSIGNTRCYEDYRPYWVCNGNPQTGYYRDYETWSEGFWDWDDQISNYRDGSINQAIGRNACPCVTVAQIIPVYAPAVDHNDEAAYINAVQSMVDKWRAEQTRISRVEFGQVVRFEPKGSSRQSFKKYF